MPWYADPNYASPPSGPTFLPAMNPFKNRSETFIIFSLFSVFVKDEWMTISEFINNGCPYVMKAGFDCIAYESFQYASYGVSFIKELIM